MGNGLLETWAEAIDAFPLTGTAAEKGRAAIRYAVVAPSSHNTQPWLFGVREDGIDLYADRSRALPVIDPDDRELVISCGAALFQLRLALGFFGCETRLTLLPDAADPDLLARITFSGDHEPTEEERELFRQIGRRRTNRMPFEPRPVSAGMLLLLADAVAAEGAWLAPIRGPESRNALADLIAEADRRQLADRRFRRELAAWIRPNLSHRRDGIPGTGLGFGTVTSIGAPLVLRTFDVGGGRAARDRELALGSPVLAVLGSRGDSPAELLRAGQGLARLLLLARATGIYASFLNQPIEVEELRPRVERLAGRTGRAQLVLRLGYGPTPPPTPRRRVEDVIVEGGSGVAHPHKRFTMHSTAGR